MSSNSTRLQVSELQRHGHILVVVLFSILLSGNVVQAQLGGLPKYGKGKITDYKMFVNGTDKPEVPCRLIGTADEGVPGVLYDDGKAGGTGDDIRTKAFADLENDRDDHPVRFEFMIVIYKPTGTFATSAQNTITLDPGESKDDFVVETVDYETSDGTIGEYEVRVRLGSSLVVAPGAYSGGAMLDEEKSWFFSKDYWEEVPDDD